MGRIAGKVGRSCLGCLAVPFGVGAALVMGGLFESIRHGHRPSIWAILFLIVIAAILGSIAQGLREGRDGLHQREKDNIAATVADRLRRGELPSFYVYLRPFGTIDGLRTHNIFRNPPILPSHYSQPDKQDLESTLSRDFKTSSPLVVLGRGGHAIGPGKIQVDDARWFEEFTFLAKHAKAIIMLPLDSPGTRAEISWLRENNHLPRTVFLMPSIDYADRVQLSDAWNRAIAGFSELGIRLPRYETGGMVFRVDERGLPDVSCSLLLGIDNFKKLVDEVTAKPAGTLSLHNSEIERTAGTPADPPEEEWVVHGAFESASDAEVSCAQLSETGVRAMVKYPPPVLLSRLKVPFLVLVHPRDADNPENGSKGPRG